MKKTDFLLLGVITALFLPFFIFPSAIYTYQVFNASHGYLLSFIKFALLATFGECLGLRIVTGSYTKPGFGIVPRALVWGFLGIAIKIAFVIFAEGAPMMLKTVGIRFPGANPADILRDPGISWLKVLAAFSVSATMNLFFAPVFMAFHRITDTHIHFTGGTVKGFFTPFNAGKYVKEINWHDFWDFVLKKTIPLFWIPAQTINFLLPESYRILVAAVYGVILGVLMSLAALMQKKNR
jgi:hypothetical protein